MAAWALFPINPYGYYVLLRFIVCGICIFLAVKAHGLGKMGWVWTLGITAVLYNPFLRAHLTRPVWSVVNVVTILLLVVTIRALRKRTAGDVNV